MLAEIPSIKKSAPKLGETVVFHHGAFQLQCCKRLVVSQRMLHAHLNNITSTEPSIDLNKLSEHTVSPYPRTIPLHSIRLMEFKIRVSSLEQFAIREMKIHSAAF
jgi:hypothetical protein